MTLMLFLLVMVLVRVIRFHKRTLCHYCTSRYARVSIIVKSTVFVKMIITRVNVTRFWNHHYEFPLDQSLTITKGYIYSITPNRRYICPHPEPVNNWTHVKCHMWSDTRNVTHVKWHTQCYTRNVTHVKWHT